MNREQMIKDIAEIQYFVKTNIFNEIIDDKIQYIEKIKKVYADISEEEIKENLEIAKYSAVGAIKLSMRQKIEDDYITEKTKAYDEYLNKCKDLELEMEDVLAKNEELTNLTVDCINLYIENYKKKNEN